MSHRSRAHKPNSNFKSKEESDEIVLLRAAHTKNLLLLNELFPTWSDEDLLYALQDTQGDLELAVARITEGFASQWDEVKIRKAKKETPRSNFAPRVQPRFTEEKKVRGPTAKQPFESKGKLSSATKDQTSRPAINGSHSGTAPFDSKSTKPLVSTTETTDPLSSSRASAKPIKTPVPQNTWASRVAKGSTPQPTSKDAYLRHFDAKPPSASSSGDVTADLSNSANNFPGLGGSNTTQAKPSLQSTTPTAAKSSASSWAKIASRAAKPKPAPTSNPTTTSQPIDSEPTEAVSTTDNNTAWAQDTTKPFTNDQPISLPTEDLTVTESTNDIETNPATTTDLAPTEPLHLPETQEKPASAPRSPSPQAQPQAFYQMPEPNPTSANDMGVQMDELNKKFGSFNANDLLSMSNSLKPESTSEAPGSQNPLGSISNLPSDASLNSKHAGITRGTPPGIGAMRGSRALSGNKTFGSAASGINSEELQGHPEPSLSANDSPMGALDTKVEPSVDADPEPVNQDLMAEHHSISSSEHRSQSQQTNHSQLNKTMPSHNQTQMPATQTMSQGYGQEFPQYYQPHQGMLQGMQHPHGAPGHPPHMHPQMMHPQNQGNYMPYYQYPYPPGPYNPYPGNNYTLQFAQKSLGGYEEPSQGGFNQSPGNPSNMQDQGPPGSGNSHGYDKSGHGKHKGYDGTSGDSGASNHSGTPMNYGNFTYGGVPNYQPPGVPNDAMYYHYYNQTGHPNMFNGYPSSHTPHAQQHQGYGGPLQQHQSHQGHQGHQNHQASPQAQYPPTQPPHHYASHQQSNPNSRYPGWNN